MAHGPKSKKRRAFETRALVRMVQRMGFDGLEDAIEDFAVNVLAGADTPEKMAAVAAGTIDAIGDRLARAWSEAGSKHFARRLRAEAQ